MRPVERVAAGHVGVDPVVQFAQIQRAGRICATELARGTRAERRSDEHRAGRLPAGCDRWNGWPQAMSVSTPWFNS
ncbi:hypothetical protein B9D92_21840, partial [Mycobacterium tuberculosis]